MLAYDPDERITAETALRHTYFREIRLAEKKAESLHRLSGSMDGIESSGSYKSLDHIWRPTRLGKQMRGRHTRQTPLMSHNMKHVAEPLVRRNITHYPTELPKLNMVVPGPQIYIPSLHYACIYSHPPWHTTSHHYEKVPDTVDQAPG
ncbi:MAPK/MAK/MRK overlapping kinase [Larimichthys crocea]|uniref:Uncharacterized protein n=1 Tax=Larimichthys crocea TaxID=215358 RepID=A0ACD3RNR8_LARCR|nr:MAPK/MAK/MRK overlapping kinase [Larimichthys crocea]